MESPSNRVVESVLHLHQLTETQPPTRRKPGMRPPFTIALTREAGSQGSQIAQAVGAKLGWPVYDQELLDLIAQDRGLHVRLLQSLDERHVSWLEECLESFGSERPIGSGLYLHELLEQLGALGRHGHCVIVGRGAAHVLPAETTLRVRIVAPRATRIATIQEQKGCSPEEAARWVDDTDRERLRFIKDYFRKDAAEPSQYDVLLNSDRFSVPQCAELIVQALHTVEGHVVQARAAVLA